MQNPAVPIQRGQSPEIESEESQTFSLIGYGHALPRYNNDAVCKESQLLATIAVLLSIQQLASAQRPFSATDRLALRTFGEVAAAPDGKTTVFSVATIDLPANKTVVRLMRISAAAALPTCSPACRKMPADPLVTER